ncbi:hypothetical protein H1R20_g8079, partial [Candolleomyces eurysporus]
MALRVLVVDRCSSSRRRVQSLGEGTALLPSSGKLVGEANLSTFSTEPLAIASKFSESPSDASFLATLCTSGSEKLTRYTVKGEEMNPERHLSACLPAERGHSEYIAGFYTDFEFGLELDIVKVRATLLYHGQECRRVPRMRCLRLGVLNLGSWVADYV